jgi:hypothetical protein
MGLPAHSGVESRGDCGVGQLRRLRDAEAMALATTPGAGGKTRIPDVCDAEKIDHCGLADLIEREDWKFE